MGRSDGVHGGGSTAAADSDVVRGALRRVPMPISVVLVHDGREVRGATISSVMPVTLEAPTLAIAVGAGRWLHEALPVGQACSLNMLAAGQESYAEHFASSPDRAGGVHTVRFGETAVGAPSVIGSLVTFECQVTARHAAGDHTLVMLLVTNVSLGEADVEPLLWQRGQFAYLDR